MFFFQISINLEGGNFKISKCDFTFDREMRVGMFRFAIWCLAKSLDY